MLAISSCDWFIKVRMKRVNINNIFPISYLLSALPLSSLSSVRYGNRGSVESPSELSEIVILAEK
jgi:hypothetical protein